MSWGDNTLVVLATIMIALAIVGVGVNNVVAQEDQKNIIPRTPPGEDVTVQRGETVALGYPAEDAPSGATYNWVVEDGDTSDLLLHTDSTDAAGDVPAHNGRVTSFRATPRSSETYTVSLTVRDGSGDIFETVSRDIIVETSVEDVSYNKLKEHAPILRFEEDELYRPTRIEAIFENAELRKGVPSSEEEYDVFENANLYDVAVRERPEGQPSTNAAFEFLVPIEIADTLWQGVFATNPTNAGTDGLVNPNLLTHLDDPDIYPQTVYAQTVDGVEFNPREFDPRGDLPEDPTLPESGDYYEELDDIGGVALTEGTYTAVGYWMMYVNDPKPEHVRGNDINSWTSFGKAAGHTGDASVVYILFNEEGEPEWVLSQQHKGGEYRRWGHVQKEDGHPVIYVAQGAHTSFFGAGSTDEKVDKRVRTPDEGGGTALTGEKEKPEYVYQGQYFNTPGTVDIFEADTRIPDSIPGEGFLGKNIEGYVDIVAYDNTEPTLIPGDNYEVSVLTGDEGWSEYTGNYLTYPHSFRVGEKDGATASKIPQKTPQFVDPGSWAEYRLFPDVAQIDAEFSDSSTEFDLPAFGSVEDYENIQGDIITPDGRDLDCADYVDIPCDDVEAPPPIVTADSTINPSSNEGSIGVNVINTGMQPHEFTLGLKATERYSIGLPDIKTADYSFYVNSIFPKNVAGAEVPLEPLGITEEGEYDLSADLSIYPDEYELDEVQTDEYSIDIDDTSSIEIIDEVEFAETPGEKWNFSSEDRLVTKPVASDDAVYVGAEDFSEVSSSKVYAVNADTGNVDWESDEIHQPFNPRSNRLVATDDAVVGMYDKVVDRGGMQWDIRALNADTGREKWQKDLPYDLEPHSLTASGDKVYVAGVETGGSGKVTALDANDGSTQWSFSGGSEPVSPSKPIVIGGWVYVVIEGNLYKINADTGQEDTTVGVGPYIEEIAVSGDENGDKIYLRLRNDNVLAYEPSVPGDTIRWRFPEDFEDEGVDDPGEPTLGPVTSDDIVYIGYEDLDIGERIGKLFAIDDSGRPRDASLKWESDINRIEGKPVVTDDTIYASSFGLNAIDAETGTPIWEFFGVGRVGPPEATDRNVYVASSELLADNHVESRLHAISRDADTVDGGIVTVNVSSENIDDLENPEWSVYVGGKEVTYPGTDSIIKINNSDSTEHKLVFGAPRFRYTFSSLLNYLRTFERGSSEEPSETGTYDLRVEVEGEEGGSATAVEEDLIEYTSPDDIPRVEEQSVDAGRIIRDTFMIDSRGFYFEFGFGALRDIDILGRSPRGSEDGLTATQHQGAASVQQTDSSSLEDKITLYRPDGTPLNPRSNPDVEITENENGTMYRVEDPQPGEWTYEIEGGEQGTDARTILSVGSPVQMELYTAGEKYYAGSNADLTATLFGGEPVTNAEVRASVELPNGTSETFQLNEKYPGVYRTTVPLDENITGTYNVTIKEVGEDGSVKRQENTSWEVEFAAPVSVQQTGTLSVEPGSESQVELKTDSEALLGIRAVKSTLSDFTHDSGSTIIDAQITEGSNLIKAGETVDLDVNLDVPDDAPTGLYTAEVFSSIDDSGTTVDEVSLTVSDAGCTERRNVGRGEESETCPGDREIGRGELEQRTGQEHERNRRNTGKGNIGSDNRRERGR